MIKRKKVMLIHFGDQFGGVEVYIERLALLLNGHADVFVMCSHPELIRRLKGINAPLITFPRWIGSRKVIRTLLAPLLLAIAIFRFRLDMILVNGSAESILLVVARLFGRKAYSTMHATLDLEAPSFTKAVSRFIYLRTVRFAHSIICVSESVARELASELPSLPMSVIPNWTSPIPPFVAKNTNTTRAINMLFVGRLEQHKGLHVLLDAMRGVPNLNLVVLGEGAFGSELRRRAADLPVSFVGFSSTPSAYFSEADVLILPSFGPEGLPLVCLEAMAHSVPCILSDIAVHRELAQSGKLAELFPVGDCLALREKLFLLRTDPSKFAGHARKAYSVLEARHSDSAARKQYLRAFSLAPSLDH